MSEFWSGWIIVLTVVNIVACFWLIWWTMRKRAGESTQGDVTGHKWDGDLEEFNNPLPRWWLWMFYITLIFSAGYLVLYPGLGNFQGTLGWSQEGAYDEEVAEANAKYDPIYKQYAAIDVPTLAKEAKYEEARNMGKRLFLTYCMQCHGSDASGSKGYPDLTDNDWLWGGSADQIKVSISAGRQGIMPPNAHLGNEKIEKITQFLMNKTGRASDAAAAKEGEGLFTTSGCVGCHGMDAKGQVFLGAANLTDKTWLYGGSHNAIVKTITEGRSGKMPAHQKLLGDDKVHLLSAYVYSLSN